MAHEKENRSMQTKNVYKIVSAAEWQHACRIGEYEGSSDDKRDGFIHLSASTQIAGTLEKHFFPQTELVLVRFCSKDLISNLKWEPSRGGAHFPHYYGPLPTHLATQLEPIRLNTNGQYVIPELME